MNDPLDEARLQRRQLIERITWWDTHRYTALFPVALACFGGGYAVGWLAKTYLGAPERTDVLVALVGLFAVGRFVDRHFSTVHLDVIDARIAKLERERGK